jgi:hypothetical protein
MSDFIFLPISKGLKTKIDVESYEMLKKNNLLKWNAQKCGNRFYASKNKTINGKDTKIYLHRFIMNAQPGLVVDHINRDSPDNTISNLRLCYHRDNQRNKGGTKATGFKGTTKCKRSASWSAQITIGKHHATLGRYEREEDAAKVYDLAAVLLFGEFALPNFKASWKFLKLRKQFIKEFKENF